MKISVVVLVPIRNQQIMSSTILHCLKTIVQAQLCGCGCSLCQLPYHKNKGPSQPLYTKKKKIKLEAKTWSQSIMFGYQKSWFRPDSPVKSMLRHLNHQLHAEEDNVEVQRLPTKLFQRISFPAVIFALLSLALRGLLSPRTNSNL